MQISLFQTSKIFFSYFENLNSIFILFLAPLYILGFEISRNVNLGPRKQKSKAEFLKIFPI